MANTSMPEVPYNSPVIDDGMMINKPWANFFRQLFLRIGTFSAPSNSDLASQSSSATTTVGITNNQAAPANLTGLTFSGGGTYRSFQATLQVYRYTTGGGGGEISARIYLDATYKSNAASWELSVTGVGDTVDGFGLGGLAFTITAGGQVQYTSSNMGGSASVSTCSFNYKTL